MNKPILGLTQRDIWLKSRVMECIAALQRWAEEEKWGTFKQKSLELSRELSYAVTEWDKYYPERECDCETR